MTGITVAIPVGPEKHHAQWLIEAIESVKGQTRPPDELLLVDDMAGVWIEGRNAPGQKPIVSIYEARWRLGVASAFNHCVAVAKSECVIFLGADDVLYPEAVELCVAAYERCRERDRAFFYLGVQYSDGRTQNLPCHACMVTKSLWRLTGGHPPETGSGASDAAFISILLGNPGVAELVPVSEKLLYWHRIHENQDTASKGPWQEVLISTRNLVTREWRKPEWGRWS